MAFMRDALLLCGFLSLSLISFGQTTKVALSCEKLVSLQLVAAKVTSAVLVEQNGLKDIKLSAAQSQQMPKFCRVQILDEPSSDSAIRTEVWLPAEGWNGRLSTRGNGGFAGQIYYDQMATALTQHYATAGTDTGHSAPTPDFALGHPEKVKDFGWRAIHDMTVQAKAVVAAYYGHPQTHAYFAACSDGGREALMEAQRFPTDYDGILAGAPAYNWTSLLSGGAADAQALMAKPESYIPATKLHAIASAVRNACDARDGVEDGVLNDPRSCHFDPESLLCKNGDADSCLSPEQVKSLKAIYSPKVDDKGRTIYPAYMFGAEDAPQSWVPWKLGAKPTDPTLLQFFSVGFYRDFVFQDPGWQLASFHLAADFDRAQAKTAADLDAVDPNLLPYTQHGGRLILYHGWNDPAIAAPGTLAYYEAVRTSIGKAETDQAIRLYMVPGMLHCSGGPGATEFGQAGSLEPRADSDHDVLTALEQWVEGGKAPGTITAKSKTMTRPLCVYPAQARYTGGDSSQAASFACVGKRF